jgi:uncharacterized protein
MEIFTYEDLKKIDRPTLGNMIPLELFRTIHLIGMYQGLPMNGKNTTIAVGRKIGQSLPVQTIEEALQIFKELKIGIPTIIHSSENEIHIKIDDCFCQGLPIHQGNMTCDLEGAILEGALSQIFTENIMIREVKCNVNGDEHCEYVIKIF